MRNSLQNLSIVLPVFDEHHKTIRTLVRKLERKGAEVIVVDDGSRHPYEPSIKFGANNGYGAALMCGIANASHDVILTMDSDGQHQVRDVENLYAVWKMLDVSMIIGARHIEGETWYRYLGRKFLNWTASIFAMYWLSDLNSGMRIFKKELVHGYREILCRGYSFTTSLTLSLLCDKHRVEFFPIQVLDRKHGSSKVRVVKHGLVTLYYIVRIGFALRTRSLREKWRKLRNQCLRLTGKPGMRQSV